VERSARLAKDQELFAQKVSDMEKQVAREQAESILQLLPCALGCLVTIVAIALSCLCRQAAPVSQQPVADMPLRECASPLQRPPSEASSELTRAVATDTEEFMNISLADSEQTSPSEVGSERSSAPSTPRTV